MGKKKGKRRAGRRRSKKGASKDRSMPLAATLGMAGTGMELLTEKMPDGSISVLDAVFYPYPTISTKLSAIGFKSKLKLLQLDNYKMAVGGALISASPRLPFVGIVARPVSRAIKRVSKGKVSL